MTKACNTSRTKKLLADTYESRACRYGCWGGCQVTDKSLIQAVVKPWIIHHRGDAIRAKCLHGETWANHRGRLQFQVHVLPKGWEPVVKRRRQGPPAAMTLPGHVVRQVSSLGVHLHRDYKHIVWGKEGQKGSHMKVPTSKTSDTSAVVLCSLAYTLYDIPLHVIMFMLFPPFSWIYWRGSANILI